MVLTCATPLTACGDTAPAGTLDVLPTSVSSPTTPATPTGTPEPAPRTPTALPTMPTPTASPPTATYPSPSHVPVLTATVFNGGNLRAWPIDGRPLDQIHAHETVLLIGKNEIGTWYLVSNPRGIIGWVSVTLLTIDADSLTQVPIRASPTP